MWAQTFCPYLHLASASRVCQIVNIRLMILTAPCHKTLMMRNYTTKNEVMWAKQKPAKMDSHDSLWFPEWLSQEDTT